MTNAGLTTIFERETAGGGGMSCEIDARDLAAQNAFERYELVLCALLSSHARSGRVLDQWEVEDLAASLPEYKAFAAVQREYNAAVGATLSELGATRSTCGGEDAQISNGDIPPSSPHIRGQSPATLATPASRRATAGRHRSRVRTTPQHQGGLAHKRHRLLCRILHAVRYPQRLLRLRRPGTVVRARDKYVESADVGRGEHEPSHQREPVAVTRAQALRSGKLVGPA